MKYFFTLLIILTTSGVLSFAQAPPPPPPPLIYEAPEKNEIKQFLAEDKTFQIEFPGTPKITKQEIENATITAHIVYRKGSNSVVNIYEYNFDIENQKEKVYGNVKNALLGKPKVSIESEKPVEMSGIKGIEFEVLNDYHFQIIRILVKGRKIYEIKNDVTNWHILNKFNKEKTTEFREETRRFFDSFKIIQPTETVLQIPDDFLGTSTETNYKNTFFGFTLSFPKDWVRRTNPITAKDLTEKVEEIFTPKAINNKAFQDSLEKEVSVFGISQNIEGKSRANMNIGVIKQPNPQANSEDIVATTIKLTTVDSNKKVIKEIENITLNGTKFSTATLEFNINGMTIYQKIFTTMKKGYSISFILAYTNEQGLKSLEKIVKTIKCEN